MYTINAIAKKLGIPAVTIRAWENRYSVIKPGRTEGGHRIYSDEDVKALEWLKEQVVERGIPISRAAKMLKQRIEESLLQPDKSQASLSFEDMADNLYKALLEFDNVRANAYVDLSFSMFHYEDVFHQILVPILRRVGEEWHQAKIMIAQEHFVTSFARQRILEFMRLFPVNRTYPKAVAFCPPGESHQLGLLLFSLFLQKKGLEVVFLGPNTSFDRLIQTVTDIGASFVCISVTDPKHLLAVDGWIDSLNSECPEIRPVLGGLALTGGAATRYQKYMLHGGPEVWETWYKDNVQSLLNKKDPSRAEKGNV